MAMTDLQTASDLRSQLPPANHILDEIEEILLATALQHHAQSVLTSKKQTTDRKIATQLRRNQGVWRQVQQELRLKSWLYTQFVEHALYGNGTSSVSEAKNLYLPSREKEAFYEEAEDRLWDVVLRSQQWRHHAANPKNFSTGTNRDQNNKALATSKNTSLGQTSSSSRMRGGAVPFSHGGTGRDTSAASFLDKQGGNTINGGTASSSSSERYSNVKGGAAAGMNPRSAHKNTARAYGSSGSQYPLLSGQHQSSSSSSSSRPTSPMRAKGYYYNSATTSDRNIKTSSTTTRLNLVQQQQQQNKFAPNSRRPLFSSSSRSSSTTSNYNLKSGAFSTSFGGSGPGPPMNFTSRGGKNEITSGALATATPGVASASSGKKMTTSAGGTASSTTVETSNNIKGRPLLHVDASLEDPVAVSAIHKIRKATSEVHQFIEERFHNVSSGGGGGAVN
ncbi:unnamed protein product [Amoebophrya sp. A120]|nr:unnamed protein product [Amoebophrya sp. A120]|eukprot:GSA120T00016442001.1